MFLREVDRRRCNRSFLLNTRAQRCERVNLLRKTEVLLLTLDTDYERFAEQRINKVLKTSKGQTDELNVSQEESCLPQAKEGT